LAVFTPSILKSQFFGATITFQHFKLNLDFCSSKMLEENKKYFAILAMIMAG
jgi:hypothetical protein